MSTAKQLEDTRAALERIQLFNVDSLARVDDLGRQMNFGDVLPSALAITDLYKRLSLVGLDDFTDGQLAAIHQQANADFQLFDQILKFESSESNAVNTRNTILGQISTRRDELFGQIWQYIAYGAARSTDTRLLETQSRAMLQTIKDDAKVLTDQLVQNKTDANTALDAIRSVAAEQGVSQQAIYFKTEAEEQETKATYWLDRTYWSALALAVFASAGLFLHRWEWLAPKGYSETVQFITSKVLIFAIIAYLLILSAGNYATHKHNAVVNRHRQNALLTYRALVAAANEAGTEDIVLAHAAACIFSPQETGFSGGKNDGSSGAKSVLELMTRGSGKAHD